MPAFEYSKPHSNRTTLIFDLDHTLIHSQFIDAPNVSFPTEADKYKWQPDTLFSTVVHQCRTPSHSHFFIATFKREPPEEYCVVYLRPNVLPFLAFCFQHFNVAFWSTGTKDYVCTIVMHLLCALRKQPNDIFFAWARNKVDTSSSDPKFVDVFTNQMIGQLTAFPNTTTFHKDLNYVFSRFPHISRKHTILVDNLPSHGVANIVNCCLILPPFSYLNTHDNVLHYFLELLQKLLKRHLAKNNPPTKTKTKKAMSTKNITQKQKTKTKKAIRDVLFVSSNSSSIHQSTNAVDSTNNKNPLLITTHDLKAIEYHSPTHDDYIYPSGYIANDTRQHFPIDASQLKINQHVLVPHNHYYRRGKILKLHTNQQLAEVSIADGHRTLPSKKQIVNKKNKLKCNAIAKVPFDQIVEVQYAHIYGVSV